MWQDSIGLYQYTFLRTEIKRLSGCFECNYCNVVHCNQGDNLNVIIDFNILAKYHDVKIECFREKYMNNFDYILFQEKKKTVIKYIKEQYDRKQ